MKKICVDDHPRILHTETVVFQREVEKGRTRQEAGAGYSSIRGATIVWASPDKQGYCSSGAVVSEVLLACAERLEQIIETYAQTRQSEEGYLHEYNNSLLHLREALKALKGTPEYRKFESV